MKKDAVVALVAVLIVAAAAWGLAAVRPDLPNRASQPFVAHAEGPVKKVIKPGDKVIMHVNGEPITESEFNSFAQSAPAESRGFYASKEGRRMLADELVKLKALEHEGRRLGIASDPAVQAQVQSVSSQIVAGKTLEKLVKENLDQRIAAEYAKERATAKSLKHILLAYQGGAIPPKSGQPPTAEQATQKAAALVRRLRSGADFGQVAMQESDDQQTASRGGTLGPFDPKQLPPNIGAAVNNLKPGQISDPVRTEYGIHVFMVDVPSLEDLRPMLTERVQREVLQETVDRLQKAAKVEMDKEFFPEPDTPPVPPPARSPKSSGQE